MYPPKSDDLPEHYVWLVFRSFPAPPGHTDPTQCLLLSELQAFEIFAAREDFLASGGR